MPLSIGFIIGVYRGRCNAEVRICTLLCPCVKAHHVPPPVRDEGTTASGSPFVGASKSFENQDCEALDSGRVVRTALLQHGSLKNKKPSPLWIKEASFCIECLQQRRRMRPGS
jgi:hypothetical protein